MKNLARFAVCLIIVSGAAVAVEAAPSAKVSKADMKKIERCKAMDPAAMVADASCIKMHKLHPEMLSFNNENSH